MHCRRTTRPRSLPASPAVRRQGKKRGGVNWDEVSLSWRLGAANGTLHIRDYFSDFPEDIEMQV